MESSDVVNSARQRQPEVTCSFVVIYKSGEKFGSKLDCWYFQADFRRAAGNNNANHCSLQ
jgi:hypothetical protein